MKRNYKRTTQTEFNIENVAKKKGDKLYVKWKGYDNLLNRSIDKKTQYIYYITLVNILLNILIKNFNKTCIKRI